MHDLLSSLSSLSLSLSLPPCSPLPFLSHFLAYYLPPKESVEMASALVGSENVQCTIVAMEQTDRQAALPPLSLFLSVSGLFTRFPSIRLIYVLTLFFLGGGLRKLNTQPGVK